MLGWKVEVVNQEPLPEFREHWEALLEVTLLRVVRPDTGGGAARQWQDEKVKEKLKEKEKKPPRGWCHGRLLS